MSEMHSGYIRFHFKKRPNTWMYKKKGKLVKVSSVPQDVIDSFDREEYEKIHPESVPVPVCLFCGGSREHIRIVSGVSVALCTEHYYAKNIGQIVQQLRESKEKTDGSSQSERPSETK